MTNQKNEFTKAVATKIQPFKGWSILLALVLIATTAVAALASNENAIGHTFHNTFTKWGTNSPTPPTRDDPAKMEGVVDGDVGQGRFVGEAIDIVVDPATNTISIEAFYHFNGSKHAFTAHVYVTHNNNNNPPTATIIGDVTEGWLKGASVTGEYIVVGVGGDCLDGPPNINPFCFQGELDIKVPK